MPNFSLSINSIFVISFVRSLLFLSHEKNSLLLPLYMCVNPFEKDQVMFDFRFSIFNFRNYFFFRLSILEVCLLFVAIQTLSYYDYAQNSSLTLCPMSNIGFSMSNVNITFQPKKIL